MIIRSETPGDYTSVAGINVAAFEGNREARLIELVRDTDHYIPALSLVALQDDEIVGHVMFSYVMLEDSACELQVISLAPLAVHPDHQRRGVGSALTEHGLTLVESRQEPLVVVEGIPAYYARFGFERATPHGITPPSADTPDAAFMVKLLSGYEPKYRGRVRYPPAFEQAGVIA